MPQDCGDVRWCEICRNWAPSTVLPRLHGRSSSCLPLQTMQLRRDAEALLAERKGDQGKKNGTEARGTNREPRAGGPLARALLCPPCMYNKRPPREALRFEHNSIWCPGSQEGGEGQRGSASVASSPPSGCTRKLASSQGTRQS